MASKRIVVAYRTKREDVILVQDRRSNTAKHSLRPALRARRITPWSVGIQPIPLGAFVINFGGGALPFPRRSDLRIFNPPESVAKSANKLTTFQLLQKADVPSVRWTVDKNEALQWLQKGHKTLARLSLSSSGGRGIKVCESAEQLLAAPLWTRYFPKTHEFRIHVVDGKAIDLTEKKLRAELKDKRAGEISLIRSHDNGWVHAHGDISLSSPADLEKLKVLAVSACRALGLDFGAVDILASLTVDNPRRLTKAVVCEVNSAPGIENEATKIAYTTAFNTMMAKMRAKG